MSTAVLTPASESPPVAGPKAAALLRPSVARVDVRELYERWRRRPPRRNRRRQSRRNLLCTLGLFVAVQGVLSGILGFFPLLRDPHYRMAWEKAGQRPRGQAQVAFLGSSRLALGWQPAGLAELQGENAPQVHWLNLAKLGGGALTTAVYDHRLKEDGCAPDLLV